VHVPKAVLLSFTILLALFIGWTVRSMTAEAATPTVPVAATSAAPIDFVRSAEAETRSTDQSAPQPIVVVVTNNGGAPEIAPQPRVLTTTATRGMTDVALAALPSQLRDLQTQPHVPALTPTVVNGVSVVADGDHIVIAMGGSIVSVGDNTVVHGNTGDATDSGTISIDVTDSTITSGDSGAAATADNSPVGVEDDVVAGDPTSGCVVNQVDATPTGPACETSTVMRADPAPATRAIGIAGWENRTIQVAGDENLASYDGSHLFYERAGQLNSNTGDVRTSGLNVIDATGSWVRSGDSGAVVGQSQTGAVTAVPIASGSGASATVVRSDNIATASADDVLVIGGDGLLDRALTIDGFHNVVTTEDGSVSVGGAGDVNAQGGDSESAGAVVMAIRDSLIEAGDALALLPPTPATQT
jgi:hypothetical protein